MPQDPFSNYQYPEGTRGVPDTTIESEKYNGFLDDLVANDLNIPRPVHRGGTGAVTADAALVNLSAEKAAQLVTNYDSHVWMPGSFRSAADATGAPVALHAFAGICYIGEPLVNPPTNANVIVSARDMGETTSPGRVYVREKKVGVWGAWVEQVGNAVDLVAITDARYINVTGDAMTGPLTLAGAPVGDLEATTKLYVDEKVDLSGDTMTGPLLLHDDPAADLQAATKQYVDTSVDVSFAGKVDISGDVMTGLLTLSGPPTALLHAATKQYVDVAIAGIYNSVLPSTELLFTRSLSQYMTRLFTTTGNGPWTMSMWVKRVGLGTHQALFGVETSGMRMHVGFHDSTNMITLMAGDTVLIGGMPAQTNTDLWLNIVWNGGSGAPSSPKFHTVSVNNNGAWAMSCLAAANGLNAAETHYIGQPGYYPHVIMKDVIFVDGVTVPITTFGENVGGVWSPKVYMGPYGTNGFRLNFSNRYPPLSTSLGLDVSGNNNHWTAANFT
jgi:hypothetical protein